MFSVCIEIVPFSCIIYNDFGVILLSESEFSELKNWQNIRLGNSEN
jgi:hypothetical protein